MSDLELLDRVDEQVRRATEQLTRLTDRRRFLRGVLETSFALLAGAALGSLQSAAALAADGGCKACTYLNGHSCGAIGHTCPTNAAPGCPSGCTVCKSCGCFIGGEYHCCYSTGFWSVTGCGVCGNGTRYCTDCKCTTCSNGCTCRSGCSCCNCCSPEDVAAELRGLTAAGDTRPIVESNAATNGRPGILASTGKPGAPPPRAPR